MTRAARAAVVLLAALASCGERETTAAPPSPATARPPAPRQPVPPSEQPKIPTLDAWIDTFGCFEIADPSVTEAYSADVSVFGVVGRFGRIDGEVCPVRPLVWIATGDGSHELRRLSLIPAPERLSERVLSAQRALAGSWAVDRTCAGFHRAMRGETVDPVPSPEERTAKLAAGPAVASPALGAELAAWAPADAAFVRFRSVEAAFRFCSEADRLGARLLAVRGEGRSCETFRWALYDLLLPTIWRTNPEGERGVGECAAVLTGPVLRGRPEIAVLLRITDADLHRMQTLAGIGQEAAPDHLWKPRDDPFPEERSRRNFREVAGDVERVATSARVLQALRTAPERSLSEDPTWRSVRGAGPPSRDEAVFLFVPEAARAVGDVDQREATALAAREGEGLMALAADWTGRGRCTNPAPVDPRPIGTSALRRLVSLRVTTDTDGALVETVFEDESSAGVAEQVLAAASKPFEGGWDVCRRNLQDLVPVAVCEREPAKDVAERCFVFLGWKPVCPCGGTYLVHPITRETSCSLHGTVRKPLPEPPPPKALLRDLVRDGTTLRFRWPIDWDRRE